MSGQNNLEVNKNNTEDIENENENENENEHTYRPRHNYKRGQDNLSANATLIRPK